MSADRTRDLPETSLKRRQKPGTDQDHVPAGENEVRPGGPMEADPDPHGPGYQSGQGGLATPEERKQTAKSDQRRFDEDTGEHHEPDDSAQDPDKYRSHGPTPRRS